MDTQLFVNTQQFIAEISDIKEQLKQFKLEISNLKIEITTIETNMRDFQHLCSTAQVNGTTPVNVNEQESREELLLSKKRELRELENKFEALEQRLEHLQSMRYETSSDSGQSSIDSEATYIPPLVSIDSFPSYKETMKHYDPSENEYEQLSKVIAKAVGENIFYPILKSSTAMFISSITSSLIAIGSTVTIMCRNTIDKISKFLSSGVVVSSLINLALTTANIFEHLSICFDSDKVVQQLPTLLKTFDSETQANSFAWFYPAITAIITLILGGLTTFNLVDIKDVIQKGTLIRSIEHISSAGKAIAKFLFEDLLHIDVTGDQAAYKELHDWAKRTSELATLPYLDFLRDRALFLELEGAVSKTIPILTKQYNSKELGQVAKGAYQLILQNNSKLTEKLSAIKVILGAVKRQETLGVLFAGEASVGKSSLGIYISKVIAEKLGYNSDVYNLNMSRKDGFYGPYGGQDFGTIDEFMALRTDDPNLPQLNQILSGDHFNFEAAHLEGKNQPSALKCVFLTSNNLCPKIVKVLDEDAAKATWDRVLRFEVIDPKAQGRQGQNKHRKPDFSHLSFRFVTSVRELVPTNLQYKEANIDEVLGMILYEVAKRELNYIRQHQIGQSSHIEQEHLRERIDFLENISRVNQSNYGQDFNIIRLQGPLGTGKTRLAEKVSKLITTVYPAWIRVNVNDFDNPPTQQGVYIIDDILLPNKEVYDKYLHWINKGNVNNFYIICTNNQFLPQQDMQNRIRQFITRHHSSYYYVDTFGASNGIARRLGLSGTVKTSDGAVQRNSPGSTTIDLNRRGLYTIAGAELTEREVMDYMYRIFTTYAVNNSEINVVQEAYSSLDENFDATVIADTAASLSKVFSSRANVMLACAMKTNGVKINFTKDLYSTLCSSFTDMSDISPGNIKDDESLVSNALCIAKMLTDVKPGISSRLFIEDTRREIVLKNNTLYIGDIDNQVYHITHNPKNMTISLSWNQKEYVFTYPQYSEFQKLGKLPPNYDNLPPPLLAALHRYVRCEIGETQPLLNYHMWYSSIVQKKQEFSNKDILTFIKDNKALTIVLGLFGIVGIAGITYMVSRFFSNDEENAAKSNAKASDEEYTNQALKDHIVKFKRALMFDHSALDSVRNEVKQAGLEKEFNDWEHDFRSNKQKDILKEYNEAMNQGNVTKMGELITTFPVELETALKAAKSNYITELDNMHPDKSILDQFVETTKRNAVIVIGNGRVHGIGIYNRTLVTVSHIFENNKSPCSIQSGGVNYSARLVSMCRKRDLAVVEVTDLKFEQFKDIRRNVATKDEYNLITHAYFIRPTTCPLLLSSNIQYCESFETPLYDKNNPLFALSAQHWYFSLLGLDDSAKIFRAGDCGLPLVTTINNQIKIIGIHNSTNNFGKAWFSTVSIEDLEIIKANASTPTLVHDLYKGHMATDPKTYKDCETFYNSVYDNCTKLRIYGYNKELHFHSRPMNKKTYLNIAEKFFENPKLPSAITLDHVTDTSELFVDKRGRINPLFSQAVKYGEKLPTLNTYDQKIHTYVEEMIVAYYRNTYGASERIPLHKIINGYGNLKGIDMTTSVGPKLKKHFKIQTKRPEKNPDILFRNLNKEGDKPFYVLNKETSVGRELFNDYTTYCSAIYQGMPVLIISKDNAKVELLPKAKVAKGKVRLFNELDLSINMMLKHFFGFLMEKVIEKHQTGIFCIGMNPFLDASSHMMAFNCIEGTYLNADFKSLDKTTPRSLIRSFVECFLHNESFEVQNALVNTLTYRLHTLDGNCYLIDCGNCSGSYVTTLMNCHTVLTVSLYTFVRRWLEQYGTYPSYNEIWRNFCIRILGDDAIRKVSNAVIITDEDLKEDAARYGLTQTPSKVEGLVSFCSREYVEVEPMIYFPKLSQDSIVAILFWYNSTSREQIAANLFTALLEASLHDREFFDKCVLACMEISKAFSVHMEFVPYDNMRETFVQYIRGYKTSPVFKEQANLESLINSVQSNSLKERQDFITFIMADSWINEYIQKNGLKPAQFVYENEGPDNDIVWSCQATVESKTHEIFHARAFDTTKHKAKRDACTKIKRMIEESSERKGILMVDGREVPIDGELYQLFKELKIQHGSRLVFKEENISSNAAFNVDAETGIMDYYSPFAVSECVNGHSQDCKSFYEGGYSKFLKRFFKVYPFITRVDTKTLVTIYDYKCIKKLDDTIRMSLDLHMKEHRSMYSPMVSSEPVTANSAAGSDQPIEPATINQAATAMSIATLPSQTNPQPTGVMPAMTSSGEDIMANLQFAEHHVLQPVGAPNMLSVGAITFDVKHLIYEQFLDADQEFEITDDLVSGSVILQIPYGVNHPFVNKYIKSYAELHGRYAGAIQYRVTVIGNPLFSGAIGIAWSPRRVVTSTIDISETQKYAYSAKGVTMPWNAIHTLHDGRQELFYRLTDEVVDNERPHLIVYLMMSLQNPLREGVVTRLRIASKLCNSAEPNPFVFSEPRLPTIEPEETISNRQDSFENVFVNATNTRIWMYTDGVNNSDQKYITNSFYPAYSPTAFTSASCMRVGTTNQVFTTNTTTSYSPEDTTDFNDFITQWPKFQVPELGNFNRNSASAVVSILAQTTMDSRSFSTLCQAAPFNFFNESNQVGIFTENTYDNAKIFTNWGNMNSGSYPVKILSLISNNQVYITKPLFFSDGPGFVIMGGYIKVVTDRGTTIFYNICSALNTNSFFPQKLYGTCGLPNFGNTPLDADTARFPYLNVDEQLGFTSILDPLPLGYQALRITDIPPSAVLIQDYPSCTASDEPTIERWFYELGRNLPVTQCVQFRLIDNGSVRVIATVRYLQEMRTFVINVGSQNAFKVLPVLPSNINITQIFTVNRTNDFALTDTSLWTPRTAPSFMQSSNFVTDEECVLVPRSREFYNKMFQPLNRKESVQSNAFLASMAAGALGGIGQGINDSLNRQHQTKMQSNQFGHETALQGNMFDFQSQMQNNSFDFQKMMQQGNFEHDYGMQERGYQNDLGLMQSQHAEQRITNREQSQNRMLERGLSSRVNFLTQPGSSQA